MVEAMPGIMSRMMQLSQARAVEMQQNLKASMAEHAATFARAEKQCEAPGP